jgi:hypothetical protein
MPSVRRNAVAFLTNRRADVTIDRISVPLVAAPPPTSTVQRSGRALRLFTKFWNIASFGASWPFTHCRLRVSGVLRTTNDGGTLEPRARVSVTDFADNGLPLPVDIINRDRLQLKGNRKVESHVVRAKRAAAAHR